MRMLVSTGVDSLLAGHATVADAVSAITGAVGATSSQSVSANG